MEKANCPVCGHNEYETVFREARIANIRRSFDGQKPNKYFFKKMDTDLCLHCGMMYRNPLLSFEEQKKYYTQAYYDEYKANKSKVESFKVIFKKTKLSNLKHIRFIFKSGINLENKSVLDVGCGRGVLLKLYSEYSPSSLLGIEPSTDVCFQINSNQDLNFKALEGSYLDFNSKEIGKFDFISLTGVIEHLSSPVIALSHLSTLLNKGGRIYLYTHDETASFRFNIKKRISLVHQLYFTKKTMKYCLINSGLKLEKIKIQGSNMFLIASKFTDSNETNVESNRNISLLKLRISFFKKVPNSVYDVFEKFNSKIYSLKNKIAKL